MKGLIGIDINWKRDLLLGFVIGILLIAGNIMFPNYFVWGYPQSISHPVLTSTVVAGTVEEGGFRGLLLNLTQLLSGNIYISIIINIIAFSLFHKLSYGITLLSAYVGTSLFSFLGVIITVKTQSILPVGIAHAVFNWWLVEGQFSIYLPT